MSKTKAINHLAKLAGAIIKHKLGDGTIAIAAGAISDYTGEEIAEGFERFLEGQNIEDAFKHADKIFEENCSDDRLKQAIHELPLAGSPFLLDAAKKLSKTYDSEKFLKTLIKSLKAYWGKILTDDQIKQGAQEYQRYLERSLAITGQTLLGVFIKLDRLDIKVDTVLKNQYADQLRSESLQKSMDSLSNTIKEVIPITNQPQSLGLSNTFSDIKLTNLNKDELQLNAQLDDCKFLIDEGNPNAANKSLNRIEQSMQGKNISSKIWFRLKALQGACALGILDDEKAAKLFEDAYRLDSTNPKAISNLAVARFIQKDFAEALALSEQAIEADPNELSFFSVRVAAQARLQDSNKLQDLVNKDLFTNPHYLRALGLAFHDAGEYAQAIEYLRLSLTLDKANRYTKLSLVTSLIVHETSDSKKSSRYLIQDKSGIGDSLREAAILIDELIEELEGGDSIPLILDAKALRGAIRGLMGNREGAKDDCDDVLKQDPNHVNALCNRIIVARTENDVDYLLTLSDMLPDKVFSDDVQMVHVLVSAYIEKQQFDNALMLTEKYCGTYQNLADNYECISIRAWSLFVSGKEKEARDLIAGLMNDPVDFILALENAALFENRIGSISQAITRLEEIYVNVETDQKRSVALKLATLHLQSQDPTKAIEWLDREKIDVTDDLELAKTFIPAIFASQQLERAFRACQKVRESNIKEPTLFEIEAHLAEILGDLQLAYELDMELVRMVPNQVQHQVNCARFCMRTDREAESRTILKTIKSESITNPYTLMQLSQIYLLLDESQKALETMFLARRLGMAIPQIHGAYLSLFLQLEDEIENLNPEEVTVGTSVHITSDEQENWISILDDKDIDAKAFEFSPKSDVALLLMGHKKDATIELDSNQFGRSAWTINEIQSKYVRALQETLLEFHIRFPKDKGIQKIRIENEDVTPFLANVAGMSVRTQRILDLYKQGQFTIEQLSILIGHNRLEIFLGLIADENSGPYASVGSPDDQQYQRNTIRSTDEITIDLTTLLTFSHLNILDLLKQRFSKIFVPQHLIDEINTILIEKKFQLRKGYRTIGYNGSNFFFVEVSKDEIKNDIKQLLDIKSYIQDNCVVISVSPKYLDQIAQAVRDSQNKGLVSLATIMVADQMQVPLFADDAQLRAIAQGYLKVGGFWSQTFLDDLKTRQVISPEDYADTCIKLMLGGYRYTSVNIETIYLTLGKYKFATNRYTLAVINALRPDTTEQTAINFAALVIADLWKSYTPTEYKFNMLDNFLRALTAGRVSDIVLLKLIETLRHILTDSQFREVNKQILLYAEVVRQVGKR